MPFRWRFASILGLHTVGALLLWGGVPAGAQVTATPESLRVVLTQGQEATVSVTLANAGTADVPFCLDFDRPLQRTGTDERGAGCGAPGELLATFDRGDLGHAWDAYSLAMTPDGRLFAAEFSGGLRTYELTADLHFVRRFNQPVLAELSPFPRTEGVTYNQDTGTLWWTNAEVAGQAIHRVLLLEGTLDGVATGRRIELPIPPGPPPTDAGYPKGASYDPSTGRFYYVDRINQTVWAIDTLGVVPAGYPLQLEAYPGTHYLGQTLDAHGGTEGDPEGVRIEVPVGLEIDNVFDRVALTDPEGHDLGVETPLSAIQAIDGGASAEGILRSRLDPNGVMYAAYATFAGAGVAAFRPAPLSPSWLALATWSGAVAPGGSADISLTFRAGERAPGEYLTAVVVEDTTRVVLASIHLTLVVEPGTPAEPEPGAVDVALAVAPNPVTDAATVTLRLAAPCAVRVALYDVLGREVVVLHDSPLGAGAYALALDAADFSPGVYVVRAVVTTGRATHALTQRVTLMR